MNAATKAGFVVWASMALFASTDAFALNPNASSKAAEHAKVKVEKSNNGKAYGHAKRDAAHARRDARKAEKGAEVAEAEVAEAEVAEVIAPVAEAVAETPQALASPKIDLPDSLNLPDMAKLPDLADLKNMVTLKRVRDLLSI